MYFYSTVLHPYSYEVTSHYLLYETLHYVEHFYSYLALERHLPPPEHLIWNFLNM